MRKLLNARTANQGLVGRAVHEKSAVTIEVTDLNQAVGEGRVIQSPRAKISGTVEGPLGTGHPLLRLIENMLQPLLVSVEVFQKAHHILFVQFFDFAPFVPLTEPKGDGHTQEDNDEFQEVIRPVEGLRGGLVL